MLDALYDEVRKEYDEFGNVISVKNAENTPATKLIEYLMMQLYLILHLQY